MIVEYENYHKHSYYSNVFTSDSVVSLKDYVQRAIENGQKILSTVEHGWQGNYYEAYKLCKENNLKLVIGAEAYWVKDRTQDDRTNAHIILLAKNENGRKALNSILSEANLSGFYYKPRIDIPLILSLPKDDVIVTTACVAYWKYEDIDDITEEFAKHFGKNFYLEVQAHNNATQRALNKHMLELRDRFKCQLIAGIDSHYITDDQSQLRDDFLTSKQMVYEDELGWSMDYPNAETLYNRFANQTILSHSQIIEAMSNTLVLRDVEEYDSPVFDDTIKMPTLYPDLSQEERNQKYLELVWKGWDEYKTSVPEDQWDKYIKEINYETDIVCKTNTADYFIDNYYIMKKGKENGGWLTKTARGSAPSFFTNKLLGFSDIDRVSATVHMFPDRFMSTTRIIESKTLPDIDQNEAPVEPFARAQKEILGEDHSYPMVAYGTMKNSAAWKLYAKSQNVPFDIANDISNRLKKYELAVKHADEEEKDSISLDKYIGKDYISLYEKSNDYLGIVTSWSIHPCSYLIYDRNIKEEVGLVKIKDNICCLMDGHWAEDCKFMKQDHLKVSVVELIHKMFNSIGQEPPSVNELLKMCPPDDIVWDIYAKGCCLGINQVEKEGTSARVAKFQPKNIAELTAFVAAIRPGFSSLYKKFENREHFEFGVPSLDKVIQTEQYPESYLLYQENIMAVLNYAGIPLDECYTAIKNIAKKRAEKVLAYQNTFHEGMTKRLLSEGYEMPFIKELCNTVWKTIEDAAGYSFNSSHAYCVALDSLYSAWFKAHHPVKFYEQYIKIQEDKGDKDNIVKAQEEASDFFGIHFLPLRYGQDNRTTLGDENSNSITNTIGSIKGFGSTIGKALFECSKQQYKYFVDVLAYLDKRGIKEAKYEPLIQIDYFQDFGNQNELETVSRLWNLFKQGNAKLISKVTIKTDAFKNILSKYSQTTRKDGTESSNFAFAGYDDIMNCLHECEEHVKTYDLEDVGIKNKIRQSLDVIGFVNIATNKNEDRKKLLVTELTPLQTKNSNEIWAYRVSTKSIGSGKIARVTIKNKVFDQKKFAVGDIILCEDIYKNDAGYWYISKYSVL